MNKIYDYQFSYTTFDGEKHYHLERFDKQLSDEEIQQELDKLFNRYNNVKSAMLDKMFEIKP